MEKVYKGNAWVFGDDISNDGAVCYSENNKGLSDPTALAKWCMINYEPDFPLKAKSGDIIVAGKNFGCGHAHDHFPKALLGVGIPIILAETFSSDFYRMICNLGYPLCLVCKNANKLIAKGDLLEVNLKNWTVEDITQNMMLPIEPLSDILYARFEHGGTKGYLKWLFAQK